MFNIGISRKCNSTTVGCVKKIIGEATFAIKSMKNSVGGGGQYIKPVVEDLAVATGARRMKIMIGSKFGL